jgi:hypothetical protein
MKLILKFNKNSHSIRLPQTAIDDGFVGNVEAYTFGNAIVLVKPGTKLEHVARSLEIIIADLELRKDVKSEAKLSQFDEMRERLSLIRNNR